MYALRRAAAISVAFVITACGPGPRSGDDVGNDCLDGQRCTASTLETCVDGHWVETTTCDRFCDDELGCIECNPNVGTTCVDNEVHACGDDGQLGGVIEDCGVNTCQDGHCMSPCEAAAAVRSYIGCEYWPVDLDNAVDILGPPSPTPDSCATYGNNPQLISVKTCDDGVSPFYLSTCDWNDTCPAGNTCVQHDVCAFNGGGAPFAIVASNPDPTRPVDVTIANAAGFSATVAVGPGMVATIVPADLGFPDQSLDHSGIETRSYHLTSTLPIIAYQFNPLNNVGVFTNDGSLLIPTSAYDVDYYAATHHGLARRPLRQDWNGYVTVVADDVAMTTVTITPAADIREGTGVPPITAGTPATFQLAPFQTLTVQSIGTGDLTGTRVQCTPSCGVFAGHEALNLGTNGSTICCADHLEDQLFPASTWGKHYIMVRSAMRTTNTWDLVRIVAQKSGTTITTSPAMPGCSGSLEPGEFCEFYSDVDVEIQANHPILVAHYLTSNGGLDSDSGDPSLSFGIPVEQYRDDYVLLVPAQYNANFFAISAPTGGTVNLDGVDVTNQLTWTASGQFKVGRIPVTAGQHRLTCPQTCGVEAEGWSAAVSYLYAGGLNLDQIVVE